MAYLPSLRASIERQTRADFRILIVDNACESEAREYFARWAAADARVSICRSHERISMFANFNAGLRGVSTPYVTFFHDDDEYPERFVDVLVGALEAFPSAAFAGSNFDIIGEHGDVIEQRRWIRETECWTRERYMRELIGRGRNLIAMPGIVFRTQALMLEGFDVSLPVHFGDFVLLLRLAENGGMVVVSEPVMRLRAHPEQASAIAKSRAIQMRTEVLNAYLTEHIERFPNERGLNRELRRRVALTHRVGMVWGSVVGATEAERRLCLARLGPTLADRVLERVLTPLTTRGPVSRALAPFVPRMARHAARWVRL